jgi:acetyl-CoA C-acetyltransferase
MNEIGLNANDTRDLTVTGGLAYFGGPWSNYSLHAIITSIELIQKNPTLKIMVIANGGYNTKQSFGIYGNRPPYLPWNEEKEKRVQRQILKKSLTLPVEEADGEFRVEGYTLIFNRQGEPIKGIAIGRLKNGNRTLAYIHASKDKLNDIEKMELVGTIFPIRFNVELNRNVIKIPN